MRGHLCLTPSPHTAPLHFQLLDFLSVKVEQEPRTYPCSVLGSFLFNCSPRCLKAVIPDPLRTAWKAFYYLSALYQLYSLCIGDN